MKTLLSNPGRLPAANRTPPARRGRNRFAPARAAGVGRPGTMTVPRGGRLPGWRRWWSGAGIALAWAGSLPLACVAQEMPSELDASLLPPSVPWSPQGEQLCVWIVVLLVVLVLIERLCAWRLRVQRRRQAVRMAVAAWREVAAAQPWQVPLPRLNPRA